LTGGFLEHDLDGFHHEKVWFLHQDNTVGELIDWWIHQKLIGSLINWLANESGPKTSNGRTYSKRGQPDDGLIGNDYACVREGNGFSATIMDRNAGLWEFIL
jgi:hypothetical protein